MAPPVKNGQRHSNPSNSSKNGRTYSTRLRSSQSSSQPSSQSAAAARTVKKKKQFDDHEDYDYSSPAPDTQPTRKLISDREMRDLNIPARRSARKHSAVSLPLDEDDILEAEAAVRPHNKGYGALRRKYGYTAVIDMAFRDATDAQHPFTDPSKQLGNVSKWRKYGLPLLASSNEVVLECLYGEGIAPQVETRESLQALFETGGDNIEDQSEWMQRYGQLFAPCLYVRELVDSDGQSPTPADCREAIAILRQYVSGDDQYAIQNAEIDSLSRTVDAAEDDIKEGFHFFLGGSEHRAAIILTFCAALENLLSDYVGISNALPLPWTFKYIGYAKTAKHRFANYSQDNSQSWFSELLRNVFRYIDPERGFKLDSHVIFFCTHPNECKIGEELLSRSAQAYYDSGTGMGVAAAGISVSSSNTKDLKAAEAERLWQLTMKFRLRGDFARNMSREEEDLELYKEYVEAKIKEQAERQNQTAKKQAKKEEQAAAKQKNRAAAILDEQQAIQKLRTQAEKVKQETIPLVDLEAARDGMLAAHATLLNHDKVGNRSVLRDAVHAVQTQLAADSAQLFNALANDPPSRAASQEL